MEQTPAPRKKIILSGMQPTNDLTFGQYAGALRNWVDLQHDYDSLFCVVDMHAITVRQVAATLRKRTLDVAAMYIAAGIDPEVATLFVQSHVPEHAQLQWVLTCMTGFGECSRMTQFKDKSAQHADNVNVGLFTYPILMAADILLYNADLVPVGEDQKQHLELTRNLAERFNHHYSDTFTVPEPFIPKVGARIMSLQEPTKKMSKSDPSEMSRIHILDKPDEIAKKIKKCKTDAVRELAFDDSDRPEANNLLGLYAIFANKTKEQVQAEAATWRGWGDFKTVLTDAAIAHLDPIQTKYDEVVKESGYLDRVLKEGREKASETAFKTLNAVKEAMGYLPPL